MNANSAMPQLFISADRSSSAGQKAYLNGTITKYAALVLAAACGLPAAVIPESSIKIGGVLSILLFIFSLFIEIALWRSHPERSWYDGRALAESVKTLTWKLAVGGEPFPLSMSSGSARQAFLSKLSSLRSRYKVDVQPAEGAYLPDWIFQYRSMTLQQRRDAYLRERLEDQKVWYASKATASRKAARQWRVALIVLELTGATVALLATMNVFEVPLSGVVSTLIAGIGVWLASRQHDSNARAYGTAALDLGEAEAKITATRTEADWAREMNDAEDAISREHTLWLASRSH